MIGVKRQAPDDTYSPNGLYNSSKRSRSSHLTPSRSQVKAHSSPAPRQRERRLQQTSAPWYISLSSAVSSLIKGLVTSETQPTTTTVAARTPSPLKQLSSRFSSSRIPSTRQRQEGGGVMGCLSDCVTPQKNQHPSSNRAQRLEAGERVVDITREADEQDDEPVSIPGPSRHVHSQSQPLRSRSGSSEVVYLGTGTGLSSHRRALEVHPRHGRAYRWENDILEVSDGEEAAQSVRIRANRLKHAQGSSSIPVMEERLAYFRSMEEMAQDDDTRQNATRTARSFERAIQDAKAEKAKKEQERVSTLLRNGTSSVLDYRAQLDKVRNIKPDRQSSLFKTHDSTPFVPKRPRQPVKPFKSPDNITEILDKLDLEKKQKDEAYRTLSTPAVPKTLSAGEQAIVQQTLSNKSFRAPRNGNEAIEPHNMARLKDGKWLSDDIIGYYIALINTRNASDSKYPTLHCFNTFFYSKIETGGQASVKRWTKKVDIFTKDLVLIPINVGNMHWIAAVINFKKKRIEYFDSMGRGNYANGVEDVCSHLAQYLEDEHKDKKGRPYDMSEWTYKHLETAPQQTNGSDCGIFTCQTLELVARGSDPIDKGFEFSSANMPFFRGLMVLEIAQGKLKERW